MLIMSKLPGQSINPGREPEIPLCHAVWKQSGATTANGCPGEIPVELGPASDAAARWWAAVLAPNQGWATGISYSGGLLPAPWSTNIVQIGKTPFLLSRTSASTPPAPAVFFSRRVVHVSVLGASWSPGPEPGGLRCSVDAALGRSHQADDQLVRSSAAVLGKQQ